MEILNNFGFEPVLFVAQIVNFLIIFLVMTKFLYKPMIKTINDRKNKIEEGLKNSEEIAKRLQNTIEKEEAILKKAQSEAKKIIDDAKTRHDSLIKQAESETQIRIEKMLSDAKSQIKIETTNAEKQLSNHVSELAKSMLEKSLKGFFKPDDQAEIVSKALKNLNK